MKYHYPLRRRARSARRILAGSLRPSMWRRGAAVPAFWWDGHPNFGDALTPWLLPRYGLLPVHRSPSRAELAGAGSIIEFLPADYSGAIWGSGLIRDHEYPLPRARVLAVRGHLTRERIGAADDVALGDPGLLVARWVRRPRRRWDVGLVPHGHHRAHADFLALAESEGLSVRIIDVHQSAPGAVRDIAACGAIVTTSLHGLVTADAFGIPAVWTLLAPPLEGGDFKFRDYESAVTPGWSRFAPFSAGDSLSDLVARADSAPADTVGRLGDGLEASARDFATQQRGPGGFPAGLMRVLAPHA